MPLMHEDGVRDQAAQALGLNRVDPQVAVAGVGQLTTLNTMANDYGFEEFRGVSKAPDGWYLPQSPQGVAVVLECKKQAGVLGSTAVQQLYGYMELMTRRYSKVVGILTNGDETRVWRGVHDELPDQTGVHPINHYVRLFETAVVDKNKIYELTAKINNLLHFEFGIKNLNHRMIFTACALVARRYDARITSGMNYGPFKLEIEQTLQQAFAESPRSNNKLGLLIEVFRDEIKMSRDLSPRDIREINRVRSLLDQFWAWVCEISEAVNSDTWVGEDVMGIFFNEFSRYKGKAEAGQVFTPEHITDLMYKILDVGVNDRVLDATCGSGAFLVKAMANMIAEAGGPNTVKARRIKEEQLYGIEFDREIYALACANMLIHKDGKTNLEHADARSESAGEWIEAQGITKVLMNPPYENKYGCMKIVENVLDHVEPGTLCGFILPDKKLEKTSKAAMKRILAHHRLTKVVKLPEDLFFGVGVSTSIFVFEAGRPQQNREFFAAYMETDGLIVLKNQGRHDVHGRWPAVEAEWVRIIERQSGHDSVQWNKPVLGECLSYQASSEFMLSERDLMKTAMDYLIYQHDGGLNSILYGGGDDDA